jgi:hypothetical protein
VNEIPDPTEAIAASAEPHAPDLGIAPTTDPDCAQEPAADTFPVDPPERAPVGWAVAASALAWLVPGAGHLLLGEWRRGVLFGALITGLFVGGMALDGKVYRIVEDEPLSYLAALGASGVGGFYIAAHGLEIADGDILAARHEYGNTFTLVAGLLNLLVVLNAFDYASLRRTAAAESVTPDVAV